jgi:threonine-phosphate decarboxylase
VAKQIPETSLPAPAACILNHGGNILPYGYKNGFIDFSANINPLGLSKNALKILKDFERLKFLMENYPEAYPESFINTLSNYHDIDKKFIFPGAGATDLIFGIADILKPETVIIVEPSFSEYERASVIAKANLIHINTYFSENFELKGKSLLKLLENIKKLDKNGLVFLASPSNPAGAVTPINTIMEILKHIKAKNAFLVLDESFMDFCEANSSKYISENFDNLIIIRSLTKFFAMPGQRLGYIFANPKIITKLAERVMPWKITSIGTAIASASLNNEDYILKTVISLNKLKKSILSKFSRLKAFEIIPGTANFFLVKIKTEEFNAEDLKKHLLKSGVLIRYCGNYRGLGDKYFRIAVRKKPENDYLAEKLKEFIKNVI